jgi:atypical dual specificity phosphatase
VRDAVRIAEASAGTIPSARMSLKISIIRVGTRVVFYPGLWFARGMAALGIWRHWDRIDAHVLVGAFPSPRELRRLHALGVRGVVNLCEEHPGFERELKRLGIVQLHAPTLDFHAPSPETLARAVAFIADRAAAGETIYVHCKAGRKRSPLVVMAYLMRTRGLSAAEAYRTVRRVRRHIDRGLASQPVLREFRFTTDINRTSG